ncbi:MAG: hypothetical protein EHM70_10795 [Chloroflexota bacterium]|nr:MAG: hypothetical protein EHM70_10795 [Chloroflexota bacterium]
MRKSVYWVKSFGLVALLLASMLISACQPRAAIPATGAEVTFTATDYAFEAPDQLDAGIVTVTLQNNGQEVHHLQFMKLNQDVTFEQFTSALQESEAAALPLVEFTGGAGAIPPGQSEQVMVELEPGNYVIACFITDADGVPHLAHGMIAPLTVVESSNQAVEAPAPDQTVTLKDFEFELPQSIQSGRQIWEVVNNGPQPHEFTIVRLAEGKTMDDVAAFMQSPDGPPPFVEAGGMQALSVGKRGWAILDLQPGNYVAVCFVPDPDTGKAHVELGMVMPFTVP